MVGLATPAVLSDVFQVSQVFLCRATIDSPEGGVHPGNGPKPQGPGIRAGLYYYLWLGTATSGAISGVRGKVTGPVRTSASANALDTSWVPCRPLPRATAHCSPLRHSANSRQQLLNFLASLC